MAPKSIIHILDSPTANHSHNFHGPTQSETKKTPSLTIPLPSPRIPPPSPDFHYVSEKSCFHVTKRGVIVIRDSYDEGGKVAAKKALLEKKNMDAISDEVGLSNRKSSVNKAMVVVKESGFQATFASPPIVSSFRYCILRRPV